MLNPASRLDEFKGLAPGHVIGQNGGGRGQRPALQGRKRIQGGLTELVHRHVFERDEISDRKLQAIGQQGITVEQGHIVQAERRGGDIQTMVNQDGFHLIRRQAEGTLNGSQMIAQQDKPICQVVRSLSVLPAEGKILVLGRIKVRQILARRIVKNWIAVKDRRRQK